MTKETNLRIYQDRLLEIVLFAGKIFKTDFGYLFWFITNAAVEIIFQTHDVFQSRELLSVQEFLKMRGYPEWTSVTQVVEEGETPLFKQYFASWTDMNAQRGLGRAYSVEKVASKLFGLQTEEIRS